MNNTITNSNGKTMYYVAEVNGYMTAKAMREFYARQK